MTEFVTEFQLKTPDGNVFANVDTDKLNLMASTAFKKLAELYAQASTDGGTPAIEVTIRDYNPSDPEDGSTTSLGYLTWHLVSKVK